MHLTDALTGNPYTVTLAALALARGGDHRAQLAIVSGNRRVITPHLRDDGTLDAHDLAAQIYAIAHNLHSDDGDYSGGHFTSQGEMFGIYAPDDDPLWQD